MRAFAAVFAREVAERRMVFLVGIGCGLPMLVASALHGWNTPGNAEVRLLAASVGGLALAVALALLYGGSMIPGETAEKRISFYFSRPAPTAAIWGGKLLAAVFLSLSAGFLVFAPGWLTGPEHARGVWGFDVAPGLMALAAVALVAACVLAGHAVVTVARLKSPWVALDLILLPSLVLLAMAFLRSLVRNSGSDAFDVVSPARAAILALVLAPLVGLLAASFAQVAEGRTDAKRAHGAFSLVLFGIVGTAVALVGGYAWWCASAKAADLTQVWGNIRTAPRGSWLVGGGPLSGARGGGSFLFDAAGGRSLRLHGYDAAFSLDGTRAAWGEPRFGFFERKDNRTDVLVVDLATGRAVETGLEAAGWGWIALSPSGRRLAIRDGRTISAYDVSDAASPRQLAAFPLEGDGRTLAFVDEDTLRLFPRNLHSAHRKDVAPASLEIAELSLPSKKSLVIGRFERDTLPHLRMSADGRFLVGTRKLSDDPRAAQVLTLHDGRSGTVIATLAADLRAPQVRFLTGNRIAVAGIAGATARVTFFEGEKGWGSPSRSVDLGPAKRVVLGGEIAPGRVAISLLPFEENLPAALRAGRLVAVDASTGIVSALGDALVPANRLSWWIDPVLSPAEAGAPWTSLFLDASGRLLRLDSATGAQTVLLGRSK